YERNGERCVADFCDGREELLHADMWFRFNAGALRYCRNGRAAREPSLPLTPAMLEKIERLHADSDARQARMRALPRNIATAVKRGLLSLISWARARLSRARRTPG